MKIIMKLISRVLIAALVLSTMSLDVQAKRYFEQPKLSSINLPSVSKGQAITEISQKDAKIVSNVINNTPGSNQLTAKEKATIWARLWKLVKEHKVAAGAIGTVAAILTAILVAEISTGVVSEQAKKARGSLVRQLLGSEKPSKPYGRIPSYQEIEEANLPIQVEEDYVKAQESYYTEQAAKAAEAESIAQRDAALAEFEQDLPENIEALKQKTREDLKRAAEERKSTWEKFTGWFSKKSQD